MLRLIALLIAFAAIVTALPSAKTTSDLLSEADSLLSQMPAGDELPEVEWQQSEELSIPPPSDGDSKYDSAPDTDVMLQEGSMEASPSTSAAVAAQQQAAPPLGGSPFGVGGGAASAPTMARTEMHGVPGVPGMPSMGAMGSLQGGIGALSNTPGFSSLPGSAVAAGMQGMPAMGAAMSLPMMPGLKMPATPPAAAAKPASSPAAAVKQPAAASAPSSLPGGSFRALRQRLVDARSVRRQARVASAIERSPGLAALQKQAAGMRFLASSSPVNAGTGNGERGDDIPYFNAPEQKGGLGYIHAARASGGAPLGPDGNPMLPKWALRAKAKAEAAAAERKAAAEEEEEREEEVMAAEQQQQQQMQAGKPAAAAGLPGGDAAAAGGVPGMMAGFPGIPGGMPGGMPGMPGGMPGMPAAPAAPAAAAADDGKKAASG
eukprot:PLAT12972.2.p1 GENE.PLAT12972.2~~PLAT12972.2.p1  ORF type:complete len:441 (+),score=185.05 PLAT12972.2:27-1325(+)